MIGEYSAVFLAIALVAFWIKPLAGYMAAVYLDLPHPLARVFAPIEGGIYRLSGIDVSRQMSWRAYAFCVVQFGFLGFVTLLAVFMGQGYLPLNPQAMTGLSFSTAFNAAISFVTNTNWQSYSGEVQLSYFSQTVAIAVQHFVSAATGMAVAVALCRSFAAKQSHVIGNFWADMVRSILYILLPLSLLFGLILVSQGVVQNYSAYTKIVTLEGVEGLIAQGPAGLQTAIKMLGSNGGGFFATNSAHPFENPNAITNLLQMAAILMLPVSFVYLAGMLMRDRRQGVMLLATMFIIFTPLAILSVWQETLPNPKWDARIIDVGAGNIEGKETRLGVVSSAFWGAATTATSNGSANAAHDSFSPLSGFVQILFMQFGEVIFGGVGSGVYGMMIYVFVAVFIAGLMVGRTPEFMGKKLTPFDIKMAMIILLIPAFLTLIGTAIAVSTEVGRNSVTNPGPHAFSQILYAFSSASNNNGSAFGGLAYAQPLYDVLLGICMAIGRYGVMIPTLALAGSFARKNITPTTAGTLPTHTPLFMVLLVIVVLVMAVINYFPALALGPVAEYLMMGGGK